MLRSNLSVKQLRLIFNFRAFTLSPCNVECMGRGGHGFIVPFLDECVKRIGELL